MSDQTETGAAEGERTFKWGDYTMSPADVPAVSLFALAQRGFTHVLGNEVASALAAYKKTEEGAKATEEALEAFAKEKRDAKVAQILAGTLGVRVSGGPRQTGIEAVMRAIAVERLKAKLKKFDLSLPTGDKTIEVAGTAMNRDQLIEAELRRSEAAIREEAERRQNAASEVEGGLDEMFS